MDSKLFKFHNHKEEITNTGHSLHSDSSFKITFHIKAEFMHFIHFCLSCPPSQRTLDMDRKNLVKALQTVC